MRGLFVLIAVSLWVASWLAILWVYNDASERYESGIGCLWALVVLAVGPIAIIAYFIVRPPRLSEAVIAEERSLHIRSTKTCWKCGADNTWNAEYCRDCGADLTRRHDAGSEPVRCPECHAINPGDARYCNQCGRRLQ